MLSEALARKLSEHWVQAWNSHDLDEIMSHYDEDIVLVSPIAVSILGDPSGTIVGKNAVRSYFEKGLSTYPNLEFQLIEIMWGISSIVLHYMNQNGRKGGEYMEINSGGQITKVVANYN